MRLAPAQQILSCSERAMNILGGEGLHQAAKRQIGHRETGRLAAYEQAWHPKIVEPHGNGKARAAVCKVKIEKNQVGFVRFCEGNSGVGILGHRQHVIPRIVFDQIFKSNRQLAVIFDNEDIQHLASLPGSPELPLRQSAIRMLARNDWYANPS